MLKVIEFVHNIIKSKVNEEDICVDMTIGNGHDTLFLCKLAKFVYGFDIQSQAIENTFKLLSDNNITNYKLFLDSHENIDIYVNDNIKCFIYNLGYLPSGDKSITTMASSTIDSLKKALNLLSKDGIIALVIYSGHDNGKIEANAVKEFVTSLNQKEFEVISYQFINQINNPPYAIIIERR